MKRIAVLGATGSIGRSTLDVVRRHPDRFAVDALSAYSDVDGLLALALEFDPRLAVMADASAADRLRDGLRAAGSEVEVGGGPDALVAMASDPGSDCLMAAIVGAAGLMPTLAGVRAGKQVLLANKEALVMAGELFMAAARDAGTQLLPIDSEHNAVFQCLPAGPRAAGTAAPGVRRILLTASGGPFRTWTAEQLAHASPAQACNHPNWDMGRKISVDSATLMNKGLEVIEAHFLFDAPVEQIEVVVHPQSVVHSLVEYVDGSVLAQLGNPDMRTPIAHALAWPERVESGVAPLDLLASNRFDFEAPDVGRFPCLRLAYDAAAAGGNLPAVLNAANEVAVGAFLEGRIGYPRIAEIVERTLAGAPAPTATTIEGVLEVDAAARRQAEQYLR